MQTKIIAVGAAAVALVFGLSSAWGQPAKPTPPDAKKAPDADADKAKPDEAERPAPTPEQIEQAKAAFNKGRELFDKGDFEGAVNNFKEAYRLSRNPLLLYNIGFTLDTMKQKELALFYYEKYVKDAGPSAGQFAEVAARIKQLKGKIADQSVFESGTMRKKTDPKPGEEDKGDEVKGFMHKVVEEAPPGKPLDITAFIPEGSGWQVTLFYRASNESKFSSTVMKSRYNELVGRIPAVKTVGKSLQYYIEARDKAGEIVAKSGKSASPHLVLTDPEAKPQYYPDFGDDSPTLELNPTPGSQTTGPVTGGGYGMFDARSTPYQAVKWGVTAGAVALLATSISSYLIAANAASSLEAEASLSTNGDVGGDGQCQAGFPPPCRSYSDFQKDQERRGKRFETIANVTLGVGVAAAGVAGFLWFKEIRDTRRRQTNASVTKPDQSRVSAVPVIGQDFVGGAAALRF